MNLTLVGETFKPERPLGTARYAYELSRRLSEAKLVEVGESHLRGEFRARSWASRTRFYWGADIIHALDPSFAVLKKRSVVTFHDLLHWDHELSRRAYKRAARADAVIAVSSQTANDVQLRLDRADRVYVVPLGVSPMFGLDKTIARDTALIGYVGDLNPRKRVEFVLEAFHQFRKRHSEARLVIIGKGSFNEGYARRLQAIAKLNGDEEAVRFTGYINDRLLAIYYSQMSALIIPSKEEGFGLPILEAQASGVPVFVRYDSRIPPEVVKYCQRVESESDLVEYLEGTTESGWNGELTEEMVAYAKSFTWDHTAEKTKEVYENLV